MITLGNAAKTLGISKPALSKAISRGHLSAEKRPDGSFSIDASELARWWEEAKHRFQAVPALDFHETTPAENGANGAANGALDRETAARIAVLEEKLRGKEDLIEELKRSRDMDVAEIAFLRDQVATVKVLLAPPPPSSPKKKTWREWLRLGEAAAAC
jgi:hypothetical protein